MYTATESGGASGFTTSGSGSIDDAAVNLPAGSTVTYTISATVIPAATGTLSNTATVTEPAGATAFATDFDWLAPQADLEIATTDNLGGSSITSATGTAVSGQGITYTVMVTNAGPSDADGATIADPLPSSLIGATYTATESGGASGFTTSGSGSIDDAAVNLPAGSTVTYTLSATVNPAATGTLSNTATVTPPAGVTDTNSPGATVNAVLVTGLNNSGFITRWASRYRAVICLSRTVQRHDWRIHHLGGDGERLAGHGVDGPAGIAVSGGNLFVTKRHRHDWRIQPPGATVNASLITGLSTRQASRFGSELFVTNTARHDWRIHHLGGDGQRFARLRAVSPLRHRGVRRRTCLSANQGSARLANTPPRGRPSTPRSSRG